MGDQTSSQDTSGKTRTTSTSSYTPFGSIGTQLNTGLGDASTIYNRLGGDWRSFDRMSGAGLAGFNDLARNTPNLASGAIGNLSSTLNRSGLTDPQVTARNAMGRVGAGSQDISTGAFDRLGGMATKNPALSGLQELAGYQGPSYSEQNLKDIASGGLLNRSDPNFERILARASEQAATEAGMSAAGMGRSGSPYHQASVAQTVGDLEAGQRVAQYQRERDAMVQANQLMDASRQGDVSARLAALSGLGGTYATGIGQGLQAAGASAGVQRDNVNTRLGALGSMFDMSQQGVNNNLGLGSGFSSLYSASQQPNTDLFNMRNLPIQDINSFLSLGGYGQPYGTNTGLTRTQQTGTQTNSQPFNWAGMLGGLGLGAASLLRPMV